MSNNSDLRTHNTDHAISICEVGLLRNKQGSRQEQTERFKKALLQARSVILDELSPAKSALAESPPDVGADILDRSACDLERTLCFLLRERGRNKLKAIDDALERIQEGTFGVCEDCGEKIPMGRLKAVPFATTCRDCKSVQEKRDKLLSGDDEYNFSYD